MTTEQPWPWPDSMDASLAAPTSHRVLLDNNRVRVLEVVTDPTPHERWTSSALTSPPWSGSPGPSCPACSNADVAAS